MKKLNYGCGTDYRAGWVNADVNRGVRADVYMDAEATTLPFPDDEFDEILLDHVLEHIPKAAVFPFLDETYRVLKNGGVLNVYVPHYTSVWAYANLSHQSAFAVGALDCLRKEGGQNTAERYGRAVFAIQRQELHLLGHHMPKCPWLARLPVNWMFNFGWFWQKAMERFQIFGFDEIYFQLTAMK